MVLNSLQIIADKDFLYLAYGVSFLINLITVFNVVLSTQSTTQGKEKVMTYFGIIKAILWGVTALLVLVIVGGAYFYLTGKN